MQPNYWELAPKIQARAENTVLYRRLTGAENIPPDRGYWTLCNLQPDKDGAEIVQLEKLGLLSKCQFHGVDRDAKIIVENKRFHPEAMWYHGDWLDIIYSVENFNPAFVYLDATNFADGIKTMHLVAATMHLCPENTVLVANLMLNDPRSSIRFDPKTLTENITRFIGPLEFKKWRRKVEAFVYNGTGKSEMISYAFYKERNPHEAERSSTL
jgi:hypothetical protein